jgi:hypothetical protein
MDYFLPHLIFNKPVATRLTAKVRETVEKQFVTKIEMLTESCLPPQNIVIIVHCAYKCTV